MLYTIQISIQIFAIISLQVRLRPFCLLKHLHILNILCIVYNYFWHLDPQPFVACSVDYRTSW